MTKKAHGAHITIVSPVYKAENSITELIFRLETTLRKITKNFEIILVEDGSLDKSWEVIKVLSKERPYLKGIKLNNNYGQHFAIAIGLNYALGDWIVIMDCDLQDQPEEIIKLYHKTNEGYEVVFAIRQKRNDNFIRKFSSILFSKIFYFFTGLRHDPRISNFGIYASKHIKSLIKSKKLQPVYPAELQSLDVRQVKVSVLHAKRKEGHSTYKGIKLLKLAMSTYLQYVKSLRQFLLKWSIVISGVVMLLSIGYALKVIFKINFISNIAYIILSLFLILGLFIFLVLLILILKLKNSNKQTSQKENFISNTINV